MFETDPPTKMEKNNDAKRFQYVLMSGLDRAFSRCKKLKKVQPKEMPWFDSEIVLQKGDGVDDRYERRHDDMGGENAENELKSAWDIIKVGRKQPLHFSGASIELKTCNDALLEAAGKS
ncbi:hypothetical protein Tco_1086174 [Tanacetum coccineum]